MPIAIVASILGATALIISPDYFMPYSLSIEKVALCDCVQSDLVKIAITDKQLDEMLTLKKTIEGFTSVDQQQIVVINDISEGEKLTELLRGQRLYYDNSVHTELVYGGFGYDVKLDRHY